MKKTIVYIGNFDFPLGNAAGKRVLGNSEIFKALGYDVVCVGSSKNASSNIYKTKNIHNNIIYYSVSYHNNIERMKYKKNTRPVLELLSDEIGIETIYAVILYGSITNALGNNYIITWCKKKGIKVISDIVDWLCASMSNPIISFVKNIDIFLMMRVINKRTDANIVISKYLKQYYKQQNTLLLPPLTSQENSSFEKKNNDYNGIRIVYAGSPFRVGRKNLPTKLFKDRLDIVVQLVCDALDRKANLILKVFGVTENDFLNALGESEIVRQYKLHKEHIGFYGHKPSAEVEHAIVDSDYTILIRDRKRATVAGFSTKVSESLSLGIPVVTNDCGDIKCYIEDGANGFILSDSYSDALEQFINICSLPVEKRAEMKCKCRQSKCFTPMSYIDDVRKFLESL